jgi:ubiquinone/menaquinone biosynthesis C-methylase UbiE
MQDMRFDKNRDAASYNAHAESYDKYIRRLAGPLADHICQLAQLKPADRVLDIGTGTGIAARRAARTVGPDGTVLGIDLSEGMIEHARRSVANCDGKPPEFRVMDAEALDLPDATFDVVLSLCAVRHLPEIARALAEMRRILRPGGRLVVSYGHSRPITPARLALHIAKRLLGNILSPVRPQLIAPVYLTYLTKRMLPEPTQAIDTGWGRHDPQGGLVRLVREAGFEGVEQAWRGHDVLFDSADEFWEAQTSIVTEVRKRLIEAPGEAVAKLREDFCRKAEAVLRRGGKLIYPYGAFYVSARRPIPT